MGSCQLSPKHRIVRASLALESRRHMERSFRQRIFHWRSDAQRNDPALVRLLVTASRVHPERRDGIRWVFALGRRQLAIVLEKQSVSYSGVYQGRGLEAPAVGSHRIGREDQ